jgi:hypothetical protein
MVRMALVFAMTCVPAGFGLPSTTFAASLWNPAKQDDPTVLNMTPPANGEGATTQPSDGNSCLVGCPSGAIHFTPLETRDHPSGCRPNAQLPIGRTLGSIYMLRPRTRVRCGMLWHRGIRRRIQKQVEEGT